jgi:hypothetical protein
VKNTQLETQMKDKRLSFHVQIYEAKEASKINQQNIKKASGKSSQTSNNETSRSFLLIIPDSRETSTH